MPENKTDFGSSYLYVEDLIVNGEYRTIEVEVEEVIPENTVRAANKTFVDKPILRFKGKAKQLVLSKTNQRIGQVVLGDVCGPQWVGKKLTLQPRMIASFGGVEPAIRIIPQNGTPLRRNLMERLGVKAELNKNYSLVKGKVVES